MTKLIRGRLAATTTAVTAAASIGLFAAGTPWASAEPSSFLPPPGGITKIASTVPKNGDINPYGVAVVPDSMGKLQQGNILVSNFNAKSNLQGTGRTIVQISPTGQRTLFASIPGHVGLTTALAILPGGWVVVGNLPTSNGMAATAKAGSLIVLDNMGHVRETITGHGINGPWDATAVPTDDSVDVFVSNVLNGTVAAHGKTVHRGTVVRLRLSLGGAMPMLTDATTVGSGFAEHSDPAALVVGPTGLGLAANGDLYVADSAANRITVLKDAVNRNNSAGTGKVVTTNGSLRTPLGLTVAPNGDVLTVNGGRGTLVEVTPGGHQFKPLVLDKSGTPPGAGALFGLAVVPNDHAVYFVDDATNMLDEVQGTA
jgi:hypothetical protein